MLELRSASRRPLGWGLIVALGMLTAASSAEAASGIYLQFGAGYGQFNTSELITEERVGTAVPDDPETDPEKCCPSPGVTAQFRLGFSIFGYGGPEVAVVGNGWNFGSGTDGAVFGGGGVRIFPIKFLGLLGLDDESFPLDAGIGVMFGYTATGFSNFGYNGTFWDIDIHLDYKVASFMSLGVKFDAIFPTYDNFAITSYKNNEGRCVDGGTQIFPMNTTTRISGDDKGSCTGRGPSATFITPSIVFTFHFDPLGG